MSLAIFNLNDASVQLGLDKDLLRSSPGYAVLNDNDLMIGELAASNTKLLPRWTNNRFWSQFMRRRIWRLASWSMSGRSMSGRVVHSLRFASDQFLVSTLTSLLGPVRVAHRRRHITR